MAAVLEVIDLGATAVLENTLRVGCSAERPLQVMGEYMSRATEARFDAGGPGWDDVQAETRRRRRGDKGAPPLTDVGTLRLAASAARPGVTGSLYDTGEEGGGSYLDMGTDLPGALALQEGSEEHHLPARPYLFATEQDEAEMAALVQLDLERRIAMGGYI